MKRTFKILGSLLFMLTLAAIGIIGWMLYPHADLQPLPHPLISHSSEEGVSLLKSSEFFVDYAPLSKNFQAQILVSYCGIASSVTVLKALGKDLNQKNFFTDEVSKVRSQIKVIFAGIPLTDLGAILEAQGLKSSIHHANESSVELFRYAIERNLANVDDYLIVNYQRKLLGQESVGHISPLAAYNRKNDNVLIMDTTSNMYPPTWVPVKMLFDAMMTIDPETGEMRGYIEISRYEI